jgi:YD repeat-containing protein
LLVALCCALALQPALLTPAPGRARAAAKSRTGRPAQGPPAALAAGALFTAAASGIADGLRRLMPSRAEAPSAAGTILEPEPPPAVIFLDAPPTLSVDSTSDTKVTLSWPAVGGAVSYRVERSPNVLTPYAVVGQPAPNGFQDTGLTRGHAYLYRVRAVDAAGALSPPGPVAMATAVTFVDAALVAGVTAVKADHVRDLRLAVAGVRGTALLTTSWGEEVTSGVTPVRAAHVRELRTKLDEGLAALGLPVGAYEDTPLNGSPNGTPIRKRQFEQLRERSTRGTGVNGSGISAYDFASARLDASNRTGAGGVDPLSRNFNWSLPLVSLPGRAGLDLGLSLTYNSLVWTRSGDYVLFDGDWGWPAPGFRLGFPVVQGKFYDTRAMKSAYLLVMPSGARVSLRQTATPTVYEAGDSSYLQLTENADGGLTLTAPGGTRMSYWPLGGAYKCTEVRDRNGNLITAAYNGYGNLAAVTDTLGRVVSFGYHADGYLKEITQVWHREVESGGTTQTVTETHRWAKFDFEDAAVATNFPGLTVFGPATGQTVHALKRVTLADGSSFTFDYTTWGQVNRVTAYAPNNGLLNRVSLDLPATATLPRDDCPRPTQRRDWAAYWNGDEDGLAAAAEEAVTSYAVSAGAAWQNPEIGTQEAGTLAQVTTPDGAVYKEFSHASGWDEGLVRFSEVWGDGARQKWASTRWTQDDEGLAYEQNPRVSEMNVYDPGGNRRRTEVVYTSFGLPEEVKEYDADATTVLRRTHTEYVPGSVNASGAYAARRIIGLPERREVYGPEGGVEKLFSKVSYEYDLGGEFLAAPEINPAAVTQHDEANFGSGFAWRGALCRTRRWDVTAANNQSKSVGAEAGYNTLGSVVFARDARGHQTGVSYADSDGGTRLAYPTTVTDPKGFTSSSWYNYDMGAVVKTETPKPDVMTDQPGPEVVRFYDAVGRALKVRRATGGAYTRWEYGASGLFTKQVTKIDTNQPDTFVMSVTDGAGRVIGALSEHPGGGTGYAASRTEYDRMGRLEKNYRPAEVSVDANNLANARAWTPAGADANPDGRAGWPRSSVEYDWKGRVKREVGADGADQFAEYGGCGCAGGEVVMLKGASVPIPGTSDYGRRTQRVYHDVLGRAWKVEVLDWGGEVYSTTTTAYNVLDQVTEVSERAGASGPARLTTMAYDGHGRLATRRLPEQKAGEATVYTYYPDDTIETSTDARGVVTRLAYDERRLTTGFIYDRVGLTSVETDKGGSTPVGHTPSVTYEYDAAGNRKRMTTQDVDNDGDADGGEVAYVYDDFSRLATETRRFPDLAGAYTLVYEYALSGALKKVTDATSGVSFTQTLDKAGQLKAVSGVGFEGMDTQFITNVSYRAWGSPAALSYGNGVSLGFSYNARGQVADSTLYVKMPGAVDPPNQTRTYKSAYTYDDDGAVKYVKDQLSENGSPFGGVGVRDRAYQYDFAGRLTEAYTGGEARDFFNHTMGSPADGPYRQSYTHDVWGHMRSVTGSYWGRAEETQVGYNASGRNPDWEYDPAGRLVSRNEEAYDGSVVSYQPLRYAFDAAGREVAASQSMTVTYGNQLHPHVISNSMVYDGDGLLTRVFLGQTVDGQPGPDHKTTYQLRSSALGGRVVSEYDASGAWRESYVYAGGERIGSQGKRLPFGAQQWQAYNTWRHADPVTGDVADTEANGGLLGRTTFDPQGIDTGESDPFPADGAGDEDGLVNHYNNSPSGDFVINLLPSLNGGRQCVQDGLRTSCAFISLSAVKQCPDNDCQSARRVTVTSVAGRRVVASSSFLVQPGQPGWDGSLDGQYSTYTSFASMSAASFINLLTEGPSWYGNSFSELVWRKSGGGGPAVAQQHKPASISELISEPTNKIPIVNTGGESELEKNKLRVLMKIEWMVNSSSCAAAFKRADLATPLELVSAGKIKLASKMALNDASYNEALGLPNEIRKSALGLSGPAMTIRDNRNGNAVIFFGGDAFDDQSYFDEAVPHEFIHAAGVPRTHTVLSRYGIYGHDLSGYNQKHYKDIIDNCKDH